MFKDNFANLVKSKQITIYKVMKDTGIPRTIIYDWAKGEREPVSEYLITLADYLNCSTDYLLGRTDDPEFNRKGT